MRYKGLAIVAGVLFLCGCASFRGTRDLTLKVVQLERGVSTKEDVGRILKKPIHVSHSEDGSSTFVYELTRTHIKLFHGPVSDVTRVRIIIDPQGIVRDYTVDELYYDGPYYQTAAEAAAAEAQQAAAAAASSKSQTPQSVYKPSTFKY